MKNNGDRSPQGRVEDRDGFECQDLESGWRLKAWLLAGSTIPQHM